RSRRGHRRGREIPLRERHLRHPGRLSARAEKRGRLPDSDHGGEHGSRDRTPRRRSREARERVRSSAVDAGGARRVNLRETCGDCRKLAWAWYLGAGGALAAAYLFFPPLAGDGPLINFLGLLGVIGIVAGILVHKPKARAAWWLFVLGQFLFFSGDLDTYSYPKLFHTDVGFPSLGDGLYLTVYPALMAGMLLLVKRRNPRRDPAALIDAAILTIGVGLLSWVFLISPNIHLSGLSWLAKSVSIAYPLGDVLLPAAAIRPRAPPRRSSATGTSWCSSSPPRSSSCSWSRGWRGSSARRVEWCRAGAPCGAPGSISSPRPVTTRSARPQSRACAVCS